MRVEQVVVILKCGLDLCLGLSVGAAASPEQLADLRLYISGDLVPSIGLELAEPVIDNSVVVTGKVIQQTLQVGGDQDIHRRGNSCVELSVSVIDACIYKVGKHVVSV